MNITVQFLEGGPDSARVAPKRARKILHAAFDLLPIGNVLLGWNLPPALVEACAEECGRQRADLYLWHPLLAGDGVFNPQPAWRTVGADGHAVSDSRGRDEFTFVCPNRPAAREAVLSRLQEVLAGGFFNGVFLDRIRFPSPAENPGRDLACFCADCSRAAGGANLDLVSIRAQIESRLASFSGTRATVASFFSVPGRTHAAEDALERFLAFRRQSVSAMVRDAAAIARARGLKVGLDCFSPTLAPMVGQDLTALSAHCDWIKGMTYIRAFGPAAIPYEITDLARWLMRTCGEGETRSMECLAYAAGWNEALDPETIRLKGMPGSVLAAEIARGKKGCGVPFFAGIEMVDLPGIAEVHEDVLRSDLKTLAAAAPDGVVLSWDLRLISIERLELARRILPA